MHFLQNRKTMDGIKVLEELRENTWGKSAKIIILSNLGDWENTKKRPLTWTHMTIL